MIISKKLLPLFIFVGFALTPATYAMISVEIGGGTWKEFDLKPYLENISEEIENIQFSSNGNRFFGTELLPYSLPLNVGRKTKLHIWEIHDITPKMTLTVHEDSPNYLFSSNGNFLAVLKVKSFYFGIWDVYSTISYKLLASFQMSNSNGPDFSPDGKLLGIQDGSMYEIFSLNEQSCEKIKSFKDVVDVKFSDTPSYQTMKVGILYTNEELKLFDVNVNGEFKEKDCVIKEVRQFEFIPNSNFLRVSHGEGPKTCPDELWNTDVWEQVPNIQKEDFEYLDNDIVFLPDKTLCAEVDNVNDQLTIFEKKGLKNVITFKNIKQYGGLSSGKFLVILSYDGMLRIWNTKTRNLSAMCKGVSYFDVLGYGNVIRIYFSIHIKSETVQEPKIFKYEPLAHSNLF